MSSRVVDSNSDNEPKRPVFLSVLCVLTFIGSGIGFFTSVRGMVGVSVLDLFTPIGDMYAQLLAFFAAIFLLVWCLSNVATP